MVRVFRGTALSAPNTFPVTRTVPRTEHEQSAREQEAVAPGFDRRLLALDVGCRVYCRWRGQVGTIIRWDDEKKEFYRL